MNTISRLVLAFFAGSAQAKDYCCQKLRLDDIGLPTVTACKDIEAENQTGAGNICSLVYPKGYYSRWTFDSGKCATRCDPPDPSRVPVEQIPMEGAIYGFEDGGLNRIDPYFGRFGLLSGGWKDLQAATFLNGSLYVMQNKYLHRVDPATGGYTIIGTQYWASPLPSWLAALGNRLFAMHGNSIREVNPNDGSNRIVGTVRGWPRTQGFTASDKFLYIIQNNHLHEVNPESGSYRVLGGPDWEGGTIIKYYNGSLYVIQNSTFHRVNPATGKWTVLGRIGDWRDTVSMTPAGDHMYIMQNSTLHQVSLATGAWSVVAQQGTWYQAFIVSP
ncbi:MAG: hypothetical protein M3Q07_07670 [Pseudobdellovibrionaceae bacterium]|nr:hypothetical protein [Pseudobdellovibrionaceae bacterium]